MVCFPHAKINLGLYITEKRKDGFHNIETVFYPIPVYDVLEINRSDSVSGIELTAYGLKIDGRPEDNLVVKAYNLLSRDFDLGGVEVALFKHIPFGAGLGGGSSDAAFMLKLLNQEFDLQLSDTDLEHYAAQLGSDCAFFIKSRPVYATGRGNLFSAVDLDLSAYFLILVLPTGKVSTPDAYAGVSPSPSKDSLPDLLSKDINLWSKSVKNDFEESIVKTIPEIRTIKRKMYAHGAMYASMSGSGSSVYGIFKEKPEPALFENYRFYKVTGLGV
ncbi:MAG: 4-(cytidine 5'-diphospho)-2-C-methyl-D-erythritol kinase [Bacteroidota bacterium]|nr:4-(cytidine 5'-diphospho)-2-C-methyl-D-erythritol kinase [Bacteroidota bacterium]